MKQSVFIPIIFSAFLITLTICGKAQKQKDSVRVRIIEKENDKQTLTKKLFHK